MTDLPPGWERRKSRHHSDKFYYASEKHKKSFWSIREVLAFDNGLKEAANGPAGNRTNQVDIPSSSMKNIGAKAVSPSSVPQKKVVGIILPKRAASHSDVTDDVGEAKRKKLESEFRAVLSKSADRITLTEPKLPVIGPRPGKRPNNSQSISAERGGNNEVASPDSSDGRITASAPDSSLSKALLVARKLEEREAKISASFHGAVTKSKLFTMGTNTAMSSKATAIKVTKLTKVTPAPSAMFAKVTPVSSAKSAITTPLSSGKVASTATAKLTPLEKLTPACPAFPQSEPVETAPHVLPQSASFASTLPIETLSAITEAHQLFGKTRSSDKFFRQTANELPTGGGSEIESTPHPVTDRLQRLINYVDENDWDMLSDEECLIGDDDVYLTELTTADHSPMLTASMESLLDYDEETSPAQPPSRTMPAPRKIEYDLKPQSNIEPCHSLNRISRLGPANKARALLNETLEHSNCEHIDGFVATHPASQATELYMSLPLSNEPSLTILLDTCSFSFFGELMRIKDIMVSITEQGITTTYGYPSILIPWQVLQELDLLKDNKKGTVSANSCASYKRKAKHLLNYVRAKEPRLYLQSGLDDATTLPGFRIQTADDHIIKACLQLKQKDAQRRVVLITEDQNLITKMIACQCEAYMFEEFRQLLRFAPAPVQTCDPAAASVSTPGSATRRQSSVIERNNQDTYQLPISESQSLQTNLAPKTVQPNNEGKASSLMSTLQHMDIVLRDLLAGFVEAAMENAFGHIWPNMSICKPPWNLRKLLTVLDKHWIAVFGTLLSRGDQASVSTMLSVRQKSVSVVTASDAIRLLTAAVTLTRGIRQTDHESLTERCYEVEATLSATLTQLAADNPDDAEKLELQEQNNMIERQTPSHAETPKYKPQPKRHVTAEDGIDYSPTLPNTLLPTVKPQDDTLNSMRASLDLVFSAINTVRSSLTAEQWGPYKECVFSLGHAYHAFLSTTSPHSSTTFCQCLQKTAQAFHLQTEFDQEQLLVFSQQNPELMAAGLRELEMIAASLS